MSATTTERRVTRQDVEAAFAKALGEGESAGRAVMPQVLVAAGAVAVAVVTLAYLAGRRRGRRKTARIEIRRL